jgi:hypothetical protein
LNTKANLEIIDLRSQSDSWANASQKLNGNWEYFVIDNESVNAFVTGIFVYINYYVDRFNISRSYSIYV